MVLVTGGTGLVGSHLLLHLIENGENVRAIYRNQDNIQKTKSVFELYKKGDLFEKINWLEADILDVPSLEVAFIDIDYVYHCAAFISFDPKDEESLRKTNIEGTANMVNFSIAKGIKKFCYVSSIAALGDIAPHETYITEETDWNPEKPHSDYAISKYGAEMEVWRALQEGLDIIIINPGVILGPIAATKIFDEGSVELYRKVANGLSFYTLGSTGFITVDDVVRISHELMKNDIKNERFTLIADNIVFQDILNTIADTLKVKRPAKHAKPLFMNFLWMADLVFSTLFFQKRHLTKATAKASYSKNLYANEKIKTALGTVFLDVHQYIKESLK
ncbi:ADP-L-glycero-D-manno-heptose-6-epimerase [Flavobacterium bizetiae]|uniref:ADP-L-glycero-D-manno-heptose-6-epimerase n=1 Tax=Flavobacterium bizetiae TaxID=2704140 RepID=A0A6J4GEG3_9FLAO|nr:NAD-dependent epimerase/dehydratase family protein [Flavobacterium bizetiae]CAA9197513.1 ADP-L-glycero-D-manno-heptose-6-epimerase [Flavobacterium bizetiae]CAD5341701.1 ADP-L-glycero-D-manno-heptose-6-epimerase [Flavobacterium bizetiae]CAD5347449.1 ADP-L-glycero-D-manno-heptose-6-epimerase [Flavobacterium bizetiae]